MIIPRYSIPEHIKNDLIELLSGLSGLSSKDERTLLLRDLPEDPKNNLTRMPSKRDDFTSIIDQIATWGRLQDSNKLALDILIDNVKPRVRGLELEHQLESIQRNLNRHHQDFISKTQLKILDIQFSIIAMNKSEAEELKQETIFNQASVTDDDKKLWVSIKEILENHNISNFVTWYGQDRKDWSPLSMNNVPIINVIETCISELNLYHRNNKKPIQANFIPNQLLDTDIPNEKEAESFHNNVGILIIDALSMCHPIIKRRCTYHSIIQPGIPTVVVSPILTNVLFINNLFRSITSIGIKKIFDDFMGNLATNHEFGTNSNYKLRRWLYSTIQLIDDDIKSYKSTSSLHDFISYR